MKLEPVAWRVEHDETIFTSYQRDAAEGYALTNGGVPITPLYAIPEGFAVVPVEPTEAMICASVNSTYGPATTKCSLCTEEREEARSAYKAMIAAKEQS